MEKTQKGSIYLPIVSLLRNKLTYYPSSNVGPSSPSWAYSACRFSHGSVQLSWNPPVVAPECCQQYSVQLSTNESFFSDTLSINVPMGAQPVNATVYCIDHLGDNTTSQVMTIDSSKKQQVIIIRYCDDMHRHCPWNHYKSSLRLM